MKRLSKVEAETYASKLNGKQLLDITRKVVTALCIPNTIRIRGWDNLDINKELVACSTRQDDAVKDYEGSNYSVVSKRNGIVVMSGTYGQNISLRSSLYFFKHKIDNIDLHLNVQKGNLTVSGKNRYRHTGKRDNQLTKLFNKVLRETLVRDYPEVFI